MITFTLGNQARHLKATISFFPIHWFIQWVGGYILSPYLFNFYAERIMRNAGLEEAQAGIKIAGEVSVTLDMQMTPLLWQKARKN